MTRRMEKVDPKTDGATPDIVQQNIEKLKALFPDVFTEGKVDFDALRETLGDYVDERQERYSFTWNGKAQARRIAQTPSTGTLRPCPEESVNWDTTQNLFIEGDNLEVLKLLQKSYHRKVKMIYIDPPYNTGGEFIYSDNFSENIKAYMKLTRQLDKSGRGFSTNPETSGRYHTDWLNMMYPRLKLARNLLSEDGAIAVQIDDNEIHNLHKLLDEIFGEENFVSCVTIKMSHLSGMKMAHVTKKLPKIKEFLLIYARNRDSFLLNKIFVPCRWDEAFERYTRIVKDPKLPTDQWKFASLRENLKEVEINQRESWCVANARRIFRTAVNDSILNSPKDNQFREFTTATGLKKIALNGEEVLFASDRLVEIDGQMSPVLTVGDIWTDIGINNLHNEGGVPFDNGKKPIKLLRRIIELLEGDSAKRPVILDFFAGSCTASQAVLEANYSDGQKRTFIVVQLPEPCRDGSVERRAGFKTIADIGKERIRCVIKKLEDKRPAKTREAQSSLTKNAKGNPDPDLGFKVFKLDASNIELWDADFGNLERALFDSVENIKPDRSEEDVLYELLLKYGLDLAVPIEERKIVGKAVYIIGAGALIVCLAQDINLKVVEGIAALKEELKPEIMRVVFKDSGFADDSVKTNAVQILHQAEIGDVKSL